LMPALLSVENWVPLKPVLGGVRDVALIPYPSCTDSIKPSLQFSCNFVVINASEGSLCFQIFITVQTRFFLKYLWLLRRTFILWFFNLIYWKQNQTILSLITKQENSHITWISFNNNFAFNHYTEKTEDVIKQLDNNQSIELISAEG
jgi:hypothetical protein